MHSPRLCSVGTPRKACIAPPRAPHCRARGGGGSAAVHEPARARSSLSRRTRAVTDRHARGHARGRPRAVATSRASRLRASRYAEPADSETAHRRRGRTAAPPRDGGSLGRMSRRGGAVAPLNQPHWAVGAGPQDRRRKRGRVRVLTAAHCGSLGLGSLGRRSGAVGAGPREIDEERRRDRCRENRG